jgi:hypothetical protein
MAKRKTSSRVSSRKSPRPAGPTAPCPCAPGVCDPERTQGLKAPAPQGVHVLVSLRGPGVFVAAAVSKQGGASDLTFVNLDIDGRNVTSLSFAAAANFGLLQHNPYGLALMQATVKTFTVGFPTPLVYRKSLQLSVQVNEPNVVQVIGNVIHGTC